MYYVFEIIGVFVISLGIIILGLQNIRSLKNYSGLGYAFGTGFFISCYTITDGFGGRISGSPLSYTAWLLILNAIIFTILLAILNKQKMLEQFLSKEKKYFLLEARFLLQFIVQLFGLLHTPLCL